MVFITHTWLLSGGVGSARETFVEGEGLRFADDDGGEVRVGRVQEVVVLTLYDDASLPFGLIHEVPGETVWKLGWRGVNEARSLACNSKIRLPRPSMAVCVASV